MILFRKIANVCVAVLLLVATTGVTLNKHYCMGRLKSVSIFQEAHNCGETGSEDPMPCCKDVSEQLKVEELASISFEFDGSPELFLLQEITFLSFDLTLTDAGEEVSTNANAPPPISGYELIVLKQSFLI